ncbi:UNVERIFIED_CONTAM: hypothetical protein Sradi_1589800 [Sesamum radiatum]|uniref:Uncharacterized protein n=1 Tax=Sesamum radiatum TaxID=300843 RepID=A0AAW2UDB9_SESRA
MVGDGSKIRIWHDKWLSRGLSFRIQTVRNTLEENTMVAELIDTNDREWKDDLVRTVFQLYDAETILSIPLGRDCANKLVWHLSKNGKFSVNSSYNLAKSMNSGEEGECSHREPTINGISLGRPKSCQE